MVPVTATETVVHGGHHLVLGDRAVVVLVQPSEHLLLRRFELIKRQLAVMVRIEMGEAAGLPVLHLLGGHLVKAVAADAARFRELVELGYRRGIEFGAGYLAVLVRV